MSRVFLGLGSNIERLNNICAGLDVLREGFGLRRASSAYESEALGFAGPPFINLVVELETAIPLAQLAVALRELEYRMGRPRQATRFSSRTLDLDILTYDQLSGSVDGVELPRAEIVENAYVLAPLAELAPAAEHPLLGVSYAQLWSEYERDRQVIARMEFGHQGWNLPFS